MKMTKHLQRLGLETAKPLTCQALVHVCLDILGCPGSFFLPFTKGQMEVLCCPEIYR